MKIRLVGAELFRADRQMGRHDEANSRLGKAIIRITYIMDRIGRTAFIQSVPGGMCQTSGECFLVLKYTNMTQNTYIQSWTVTEIMAREVWNFNSCYTLIDYQIYIKTGRNMLFL